MAAFERYTRQLPMPEIGADGQKRLARSSVLVVGCGGLGSTLLFCLAGAGVGKIAFADGDDISLSNLNRQFLHTTAEIGRNKALSAYDRLHAFNPTLQLIPIPRRLTPETLENDVLGFDVVVTAVDSVAARMHVNAACVSREIPLIDGGVNGLCGTVLSVRPHETACLACLYDGVKEPARSPNSFAPTVSVISAMEAQAALQLLLGRPDPLAGKMLIYDGATLTTQTCALPRNEHCSACGR